jgi:hypothetical protein
MTNVDGVDYYTYDEREELAEKAAEKFKEEFIERFSVELEINGEICYAEEA